MVVHSILPEELAQAVDDVLRATSIVHVAHGDRHPVDAAARAADDPDTIAVIGPFRSGDVAAAVEATAPRRIPMLAPVATWVGVTRSDEPGCEYGEFARHDGTMFRMVARDSVVAERIADRVRDAGQKALVIAGHHGYGHQLDAQLARADLPRTDHDADVIVLCGLAGEPEIERARELAPLPVIAFDGVQGADLGDREALVALVYQPGPLGVGESVRAAQLIADAVPASDLIAELRADGPFDEHGDPVDPLVRFEPL